MSDFHTPEYRQRVQSNMDSSTNAEQAEQKALDHMMDDLSQAESQMIAVERRRSNQEASQSQHSRVAGSTTTHNNRGTLLEAAFVDPAYPWPPADGQGKNAIELQASLDLLNADMDNVSVGTTESLRQRMQAPTKTPAIVAAEQEFHAKKPWWKSCCCRKDNDAVAQQLPPILQDYQDEKRAAAQARQEYQHLKASSRKERERAQRKQERYQRIPEGVLIYQLNTTNRTLTLRSPPHSKTNLDELVEHVEIAGAQPSGHASRRGLVLTDPQGRTVTLTACEQRTAISWLEAIQLMLAKSDQKNKKKNGGAARLTNNKAGSILRKSSNSHWAKANKSERELDTIEEQYLNLANYSNKLIRAGALPGTKKGMGGAGGIYYSVEKATAGTTEDDEEDEALEAIAKRRAVIKDSWDFYRMICSLLRDRHKYDEVFRRMQLDSVYPYLNSMTGLADNGNDGYENPDKEIIQPDLQEYASMTRTQVAQDLVHKATAVMPSLVEICKALAGSLGMEEVGVGPVKEVTAALRKAEKKYNGDILKVTDFCRALLVVKDFPSLLAMLELARDSFGPLIRRVKMSSLKSDHKAKAGGYRDCIINVELKQHICEIQVHLWPMWTICGVDGFRHYRHCLEYSTDSFTNAYDALDGLDRKTMAELIVMAEEAVAETPLDNLEWYHEKYILDYFAEAGLFMKHDLMVWAEVTYRQLIRLRTESPDIGPDHHETIRLYKYLIQTLQAQGRNGEANELQERINLYERARSKEAYDAEQSMWDYMMNAPTDAYDLIMDPNRKEREKEEAMRKEVKASKRAWRQIRQERFPFLDADLDKGKVAATIASEEKKSQDHEMVM